MTSFTAALVPHTLTVDRRAHEHPVEHVTQTAEHDGKEMVFVDHLTRQTLRTEQLDADVDDAVRYA